MCIRDSSYGQPFTRDTIDEILNALAPSYVAGLSFLGGEPLEPENQGSLLELARLFKERFPEKTLWCYTGLDVYKRQSLFRHTAEYESAHF